MIDMDARQQQAAREKESSQLMGMLEDTVKQAQELTCRICERLSSVANVPAPRPLEPTKAAMAPVAEWVPLLNGYRRHVQGIREALDEINDCVSRLEI